MNDFIDHNEGKISYVNPVFKRVRAQLGAPVMDVELTDDQMSELLDSARETFHMLTSTETEERKEIFYRAWTSKYLLALCKEALGRIRSKYNGNIPVPGSDLKLNYRDLLIEAQKEKRFLKYLILKDVNVLAENHSPILVFYIGVGNLENADVANYIHEVQSKMDNDDGFIKYFIPIHSKESKIECVYPVSGVDADTKNAIMEMEKTLKNIKIDEDGKQD